MCIKELSANGQWCVSLHPSQLTAKCQFQSRQAMIQFWHDVCRMWRDFSKCSTLVSWSTTARHYINDKNLWSVWVLVHMTVKHLQNKQVRWVWASSSPHTNMLTITAGEQRLLFAAMEVNLSGPMSDWQHFIIETKSWTLWKVIKSYA
jgi:hypothetical protein